MRLLRLDPDDPAHDALVEQWCAVLTAAGAVDAPFDYPRRPRVARVLMRRGWDGDPVPHLVALEGDEVVGAALAEMRTEDNRDLAWLTWVVRPDLRRQGRGRRLWSLLCGWVEERGRGQVGTSAWQDGAGEAFARSLGLSPRLRMPCRVQQVDTLDSEAVAAIREEAASHAVDYELVRIAGAAPPEWCPGLAGLAAVMNDAPVEELDYEEEVVTADRVRLLDESLGEMGLRPYRIVARHRTTGELAGYTWVCVDGAAPDEGHQEDTGVVPAHRGHRLGLLLKAEMMQWLAEVEPDLRTLITWNAGSNGPMLAINERLGYRLRGVQLDHQTAAADWFHGS